MDTSFDSAIAALQTTLKKQLQTVRETKRVINRLCIEAGNPPLFQDVESDEGGADASIKRDSFYGLPLATAITKYLEGRRSAGRGPATVAEIHETLVQGGFVFETNNSDNAKRGIYISLAKNSTTFHKLPSGSGEAAVFGMRSWYPNAKSDDDAKKPKKGKARKSIPKPSAPAAIPDSSGSKSKGVSSA